MKKSVIFKFGRDAPSPRVVVEDLDIAAVCADKEAPIHGVDRRTEAFHTLPAFHVSLRVEQAGPMRPLFAGRIEYIDPRRRATFLLHAAYSVQLAAKVS